MLTFALVVAKANRAVPDHVRERLDRHAHPAVPFVVSHHQRWSDPSGRVAFGGWSDAHSVGGTADTDRPDGGLAAVSGSAWVRDVSPAARTENRLDALVERARRPPLGPSGADLLGIFTLLTLDAGGRGALLTDPLGLSLVYRGSTTDVTVFATRAALAADLVAGPGGMPRRDALGSCWLGFTGAYAVGPQTGFADVEVLNAAHVVDVDPERGATSRVANPPPWAPQEAGSAVEVADRLRAAIATSLHHAARSPRPRRSTDLTGGVDSRLVLAVLLAEGLADDFTFHTSGSPELPDVVVAQTIAERFGLRHELAAAPERRAGSSSADLRAAFGADHHRELVMRRIVGACSGMRNVWEPTGARPPDGSQLRVTGLCGEALATNFPESTTIRSRRDLKVFLRRDLHFGSAGILRPEAKAWCAEQLEEIVATECDTEEPRDVVDAFYIRTRLRRWFGTALEINDHNRIFPLYSPEGIRGAFAIGADDRQAQRLHFEVMHQACDELARLPFATGGWDPRLIADRVGDPAPYAAAITPPRRKRLLSRLRRARRGGPRWNVRLEQDDRARRRARDRDIMQRFLVGDPGNPAFEVFDRAKVVRAVGELDSLPFAARVQLYGALTAALWLGGSEIDPQAIALRDIDSDPDRPDRCSPTPPSRT